LAYSIEIKYLLAHLTTKITTLMPKTYKIKLEDKAAFLNRLDKAGIPADSYDVVDNKFEGYFEFTTTDPVTDKMVGTILKQSPKINRLKEMLRTLVREELKK
jgi:hypothetical protein